MANEAPRMQQFFIPSIGTAPKWCSYLEALTEELEETQSAAVYDDYKFVTKEELDQLSLSHLIGSSVLRAYMHGYFLDRRLYEKAQLITQPFAYEKYKNRKVQDIMHQERENRVIINKAEVNQPKVNKELAARLKAEAEAAAESAGNKSAKKKKLEKKKASTAAVILQDDRFKKLFADEDFEVDQDCELFKRNVAIQKKESSGKVKEILYDDQDDKDDEVIEQSELPDIDDMNETTSKKIRSAASSSSDDDSETDEETLSEKKRREREKARRKLERRERQKQLYEEKTLEREAERTARLINKPKKFVLHELDSTEGARRFLDEHVKEAAVEEESSSLASKKSLMQQQGDFEEHEDVFGERSITFNLKKRGASAREAKAIEERVQTTKLDGEMGLRINR
ncbi:NUC153 domain protein [Teladorsagia circumcincta]|uniref:NUC153 domain protein n=1 Tax=Teladorsagia circumcincta TaxID=45464 RepID=A0A2G9V0K8_TELCI|nr:NUC153 domain protein [Teladorsagia circumcincta]